MTFPGIIDEPGSFSGSINSPNPERGPLPKNLISLAILNKLQAIELRVPWNSTKASFPYNASNLLGAVVNLYPVVSLTASATLTSNPSKVFKPVPTAVPP